jgi:single-stranded DNA-binding protein
MNPSESPSIATNLVVLRGSVANAPALRDLPSGSVVAQFDVVTPIRVADRGADRGATTAVPVAWTDPSPSDLARVGEGIDVVVVGTVRRRFFRVAGATQSRTEVVADAVIPTRRRRQVDRILHTVADRVRAT